jgi:hypothetical protein
MRFIGPRWFAPVVGCSLVSALIAWSPSVGPPVPGLPVSIPFTTTDEGLVVIPATVQGTVPVHLIFDTGAGFDVLAPSLIARLHGIPSGWYTGFRMWGDRIDIPLYTIGELAVGPIVRKNVTVGGWDLLDQMHLDGIISVNELRHQPFTFDFVNKVVVLESPETMAQRRRVERVSPIQIEDHRGIALEPLARFLFGADSGQCELDTGSPSTTINSRYLASLQIDTTDSAVRKRETRTTAGVAVRRYVTTAPGLALAAAPDIAVERPRVAFADIIYDCVAGIDFWSGTAVTFDIAARELLVSSVRAAH